MELITSKIQAQQALPRLVKMYGQRDPRVLAVRSMGEDVDPDKLDAIMGNGSWTEVVCDECNKRAPAVVRFGTPYTYDESCRDLCQECLKKALELLTKQPVRVVVSYKGFCTVCNILKTLAKVGNVFVCDDCTRKVIERLSIEEFSIVANVPL